MFQDELLSRIAQKLPLTVMTRALLENVLNPEKLDAVFQKHVRKQRSRKILFSFVVELMLLVACKIRPKIHSAYKAWHEELPFLVDAVYDIAPARKSGSRHKVCRLRRNVKVP